MDGSFKPPKQTNNGQWRREKVGYGIYDPFKNLNIAEKLPGLQNILRAKMMAIHHTLQLLTQRTKMSQPTYSHIV